MFRRLLIVGLGSIGRRHARLARALAPDAQIIALRRPGALLEPAGDVNVCVSTLEDALARRPEIAVIASPASHHMEVALPLADAGVHLLIEEPISSTLDGVAELIERCRSAGATLMVGYNLRFLRSLQLFRELVLQGRVGRPLSVRVEVGQYLPDWRPGVDYRASVSARSELGGGVLLELSHEIDYLRWIFGEIRWVSAAIRTQSQLEIDVEDTAHLTMELVPRGGPPVLVSLVMDFVRRDSTRTCIVIGASGSLRWNAIAGTVETYEAASSAWRELHAERPARDDTYIAEWAEFLRCVETGVTPSSSGEDGLAVLRAVLAARRSSATGHAVPLDSGVARGQ